ncbi:MAG: DUF983 domain-containing protein [Bacteroidota bacterium]
MASVKKPSLTAAIFGLKCSSCRRGKMFKHPTLSFKEPFGMNSHCPQCGADLEPEPGFYFGAMFISYAISAWPLLGLTLFFRMVLEWSLVQSFAVTTIITAFLFIYIFRVSRAMYLHMIVKYSPARAKLAEQKG